METKFDQLIAIFNTSPLSTDVLLEIIFLLQQQHTNESLSSFISQSLPSLLILKQWTWQLFSEDHQQWINQPYYQEFFQAFASFNKNMIYQYDNIDSDTKASLLFPETVDQVNRIFQQIEQTADDNDVYIAIVSRWFDNHSYFLHDNPLYGTSPIIDHIGQYILRHYIMSKQYKHYLTQLQQPQLSQAVFAAKMLFYIKTCSFYSYGYLDVKFHDFPYSADEMLYHISNDYLQIIHAHSLTVTSWSQELLGCIAQLASLVCGCCWWDGEKRTQMKILFPTEKITCDHIEDLTRIISYKPFYKQTKPVRSNDETILMGSVFVFLIITVQTQNISWLFRSNRTIRDAIVTAAEAALNDEVSLCGYVILGETLADEHLKDLKIADNISGYLFTMLEQAWYHPSKIRKQISMQYFLRGFQTLCKNDSIQQNAAHLHKISLFIEMCDQHPIAFDIIWALSFNRDIQQQLRSSSAFMSKLAHLAKECCNEQMSKTVHGILWNLEINHQDHAAVEINSEKTFDIMISYSHKEKTLCQHIYNELVKSGYRVWIDFDQLHGNVMDAMAQAIERSRIVLICMSEQYRKSNYCRAEAHYAFQRQRKIVPVLLQEHYKPDGWLLFLVGQLLYVDFTKYELPRAMNMLLKELKIEVGAETNSTVMHTSEDTHTIVSIPSVTMPRVLLPPTESPNMLEWTETQVHQWLVEHNLNQMSRLLMNSDGRSLIYLNKYIRNGQTEQILNLLQEDCLRRIDQSISLIELSRFHSLMDQQKRLLQTIGTSINIKR